MCRTVSIWTVGIALSIAGLAGARAQESELRWVSASGGAIPAGALAYGREADGREQFPCRGAIGGGTHLGKITRGFSGCNVGYGGKELTLAAYEVLARPPRLPLAAANAVSAAPSISSATATTHRHSSPALTTTLGIERVPPLSSSEAPSIPPGAMSKHGFDKKGEPYVDVRLPDGTIRRTQPNGVTFFKKDGTKRFVPITFTTSDAPPPTPPELPDDPRQGRAWVERHNRELLDVIRSLVNSDEAEMKKFSAAEKKTAGGNVFAQIAYRTEIADFLAKDR
jgi:hypothetical protein